MGDLTKILLGSFVTVISGTVIYIVSKLFIDSIFEQRKIIGDILSSIYNYSITYMVSERVTEENRKEASTKIFSLARELIIRNHSIPIYHFWELLKFVPLKTNIIKASEKLYAVADLFFVSPFDYDKLFKIFNEIRLLINPKFKI